MENKIHCVPSSVTSRTDGAVIDSLIRGPACESEDGLSFGLACNTFNQITSKRQWLKINSQEGNKNHLYWSCKGSLGSIRKAWRGTDGWACPKRVLQEHKPLLPIVPIQQGSRGNGDVGIPSRMRLQTDWVRITLRLIQNRSAGRNPWSSLAW